MLWCGVMAQAQFEVVSSVLGATRCALYFRREDPATGTLEFVPAAVYPEKQRVWVVGEGPGGLPSRGAFSLPGFIDASSLLPEYPMMPGDGNGKHGFVMADGGLSVPLEYGGVVMGMVAVWREGASGAEEWTTAERQQVGNIATSLAVAMVLDQRRLWEEAVQTSSLRQMLSETLHQVKNSLSAVRMFGKLLLRRLPNDDQMNRELAKVPRNPLLASPAMQLSPSLGSLSLGACFFLPLSLYLYKHFTFSPRTSSSRVTASSTCSSRLTRPLRPLRARSRSRATVASPSPRAGARRRPRAPRVAPADAGQRAGRAPRRPGPWTCCRRWRTGWRRQ